MKSKINNILYNAVKKAEAKLSASERKKKQKREKGKKEGREKLVGKDWKEASIQEKAKFVSLYQWNPKTRKWIKRKEKRDLKTITENLKKASKRMKQIGKRAGKKGGKTKRVTSDVKDYSLIFLNVEGLDKPDLDEMVSVLLAKATRKNMNTKLSNMLYKVFNEPSMISYYKLNNKFVVVVYEGSSFITFICINDIINSITSSIKNYLKVIAITPSIKIIPAIKGGKEIVSLIDMLEINIVDASFDSTELKTINIDYTKEGRTKQTHNALRLITEVSKAFNKFSRIIRNYNSNFIYLKECDALGNLRSKPSKEIVKNFKKIVTIVTDSALSIKDKDILEVLNILQSPNHIEVYKDYLNSIIDVKPISVPLAVNPLGKGNREIKDVVLEKKEVVRADTIIPFLRNSLYKEVSL